MFIREHLWLRIGMLRGFQWDLGRQVERLDWLLAQLPKYADWGYNELYLHLEDAVEFPSVPGVARADAYTHRQLGQLVSAAERVGIKTVPIVNLLGHTQYLVKVPALRDLNELRAADGSPLETGQICPVHPRALDVARHLLSDMAPFCTAGKVHVGLDESFHLGRHPLSRREIERVGLAAHFAGYVKRLNGLAHELDLQLGMWADMLYFLPNAIPLLPADIAAYEWYYYAFGRRPRVEMFNFRESNLGEKLVARGIEYWGCPMNGAFRYEPMPHFSDRLENILSWWRRCRQLRATGMLMTSWEPYRLAIELTTVIDAAAASLWLDGVDEPRAMLERGFARVFGKGRARSPHAPAASPRAATPSSRFGGAKESISPGAARPEVGPYLKTYSAGERAKARNAARAALACDRFPFSGYPRWEINARWDVVSRRESVAAYRREERWFRRLMSSASLRLAHAGQRPSLPEPLQASLELRWYLAFRDVWVREALRGKRDWNAMRRALHIGRKAAQVMWRYTRDPKVASPNEAILRDDQRRVAALRRGEFVFSRWQLCYRVENVAPAVQLVAVEQRQPDGSWSVRQACHTIEFQAVAANRRGKIVREHAAPVEWNGEMDAPPELRIVTRGIGAVRISDVALTDGRTTLKPDPSGKTLGRSAPARGFPKIDWAADTGKWRLWVRGAVGGAVLLDSTAPERSGCKAPPTAQKKRPAEAGRRKLCDRNAEP